MLHNHSTWRIILGSLLVVLSGLGLGFASSHFLPVRGDTRSETLVPEWAGGWSPVAASRGADDKPRAEPNPRDAQKGKRALLVGVTKYDNLASSSHLSGPGNDVRLLRTTLVERYRFPPENVVSLTEDEGKSELRPTRANIAREFKRLAEAASAGEQVVVLLAGHGDRQPESDPPDPVAPEPDGIDEIFLPADVKPWEGGAKRVPNAIADKEIRDWLGAITAKKAYVWAIFDCCHSGSMTRAGEVVRQLPEGILVPPEELAKARERAAKRTGRAAPDQSEKGHSSVPTGASDYLVATFACREYETTPESRQPADSIHAKYHGLLTYSVVSGLEQSASSATPLTYRELMQRVQSSYLARPQGAPTPTIDGVGQDRVVLGTDKPIRPKITLMRIKGEYVVNVGDLHRITQGSILRVYSPAGEKEKPRVLGHVRVEQTRPLDSIVVAIAYEGAEKPAELPASGLCEVVAVNYLSEPLRIGIDSGNKGQDDLKREVVRVLRALPKEEAGLFQLEEDLQRSHFVMRMAASGPELVAASGLRPPVPLPALDSEQFGESLAKKLKAIYRARGLISVGANLQGSPSATEVKIEVIGHRTKDDPGQVIERPSTGWVFRPGDRISFRITNTSKTKRLEVTLLIVDPDYQVQLFFPARNEINKALEPGTSFNTGAGTITDKPPFGPEYMVAIITSPTNPPVDYSLLTQAGIRERGYTPKSAVAQLLEHSMHGAGSRSGLTMSELDDQGARVLNWRTEPTPKK